ncbi:MAG: hypothetical protein KC503_38575 [Myxococcales bacterium]|nr:hypothetical protein [Myxococcales bacterium]
MRSVKNLGLLSALIVAFSLAVTACGDSSNQTPDSNNNKDSGPVGDGAVGECPAPATKTPTGYCLLDAVTFTEDFTITADKQWAISGPIRVGKSDASISVTLTIEAGTTIVGIKKTGGAKTFLVVERGSKIMADGTKDKPIVFTSGQAVGNRKKGDWGGVVINGRAPNNKCPQSGACDITAEAQQGIYGGDKADDNSGVLRYVRVEYAGEQIDTENEFNGLTFNSVGSATLVEYIQGHRNADDCIEFFGGTVNVKYVLCTGNGDDNLDWTDGWTGKAQFVVIHQFASTAEADANGIEGDNQSKDNSAEPRSNPTLSNMTLIGVPDSTKSLYGMRLRRGTGAKIYNTIIENFGTAGVQLDSAETYNNAWDGSQLNGNLMITRSLLMSSTPFKDCGSSCTSATPFKVEDWFNFASGDDANKQPSASQFTSTSETAPDYVPKAGSDALSGGQAPSDSFFTQVTFRGGVDPANDWTKGWTTFSEN